MASKCTAIGIDLGTTNSCVAVWNIGAVEIVSNELGRRQTPSMVAFTDIQCLVGNDAKAQGERNPENTVFGVKRIMGRKFNEELLQEDMKMWPFKVVSDENRPKIEVRYRNERKLFSPEEISAQILRKMKRAAEARLTHIVTDAVITVPAYFNDSQRQATHIAGKIAGLNVLQILNESTAAAIAYRFGKMIGGRRNVIVFGLDKTTFHVTIMTIQDGNCTTKAVAWDTHLGGEDIDGRLVDYFVKEFKRQHHADISSNNNAMSRLKKHCKLVKRRLSLENEISVCVVSLFGRIDLNATLSRGRFEELNKDFFTKTIMTVSEALQDAKMEKSDIDDVVLVGGCTRIPKIQTLLREFFDGKKLSNGINPDEAVAHGAAIQAALLQGDKSEAIRNLHLTDVIPLSWGIATGKGTASVAIKRNTIIPKDDIKILTTRLDNQREQPMIKNNHTNDTRLDDHTMWRLSAYLDVPKWTQIGRQLGLNVIAIYNIEQKCRNKDNREHVDTMLLEWRQQYPEQCNLLELVSALKNLKLNDIATHIQRDFLSK